jgi:hypothetical protein
MSTLIVLFSFFSKITVGWGVAKEVEHLSSKCEVLGSIPSTAKKYLIMMEGWILPCLLEYLALLG